MSDTGPLLFFAVMFFWALILAFAALWERDTLKEQAVERGYAEWKVDNSGSAEWQWKDKALAAVKGGSHDH
jgi:hypothetical protein